jgi:hypothetical protein
MFNKQQDKAQAEAPISADDIAAADKVAASVGKWGMSAPALLLLTMGRPLGFFGAQMLYVGGPMLRLLGAATGKPLAARATSLAQLLENPAALEHLTARLEQGERK